MVELMKSRLHGKQVLFLPFFLEMSSKITQFQMLPESTIFNFKILNFLGNRSVLVKFENVIFMG